MFWCSARIIVICKTHGVHIPRYHMYIRITGDGNISANKAPLTLTDPLGLSQSHCAEISGRMPN